MLASVAPTEIVVEQSVCVLFKNRFVFLHAKRVVIVVVVTTIVQASRMVWW